MMGRRRAEDAARTLLRSSASQHLATHHSGRIPHTSPPTRPLLSLLAHHATPPHQRRGHATKTPAGRRQRSKPLVKAGDSKEPNRIAILGGGLTGLTAAYYLALTKDATSNTKITIYEAGARLGGWVRTDKVPVDVDGVKGTVKFERGPRLLSSLATNKSRFDDLVFYDLVGGAFTCGRWHASPHSCN